MTRCHSSIEAVRSSSQEAPRHLCLFARPTLQQTLRRAGYLRLAFESHLPMPEFLVDQNLEQSIGQIPDHSRRNPLPVKWRAIAKRTEGEQMAGMAGDDILISTASL